MNYVSTAIDPNNSNEIKNEAWVNAAVAVGMELIEPDEGLSPVSLPIDDLVRLTAKNSGYDITGLIFRSGSDSIDNLTPRPGIDDLNLTEGGLSFFNDPSKLNLDPGDKYIGVDPLKLDGLDVIFDNNPPGHVSVRPLSLNELKEWASTRKTGIVHELSTIVKNSVVLIKKWLK